MSVETIDKQLKSGEFSNLYLFYGENDYDKLKYSNAIIKKAVSAGSESFNLQVFDGSVLDISHAAAAVNNMPLMSPYKCILFKDPDIDGFKSADLKELEGLLNTLPPECIVIFSLLDKKYDNKYARKSSKWKTLLTLAQKKGVAVEMVKPSRTELMRILQKRVKQNQSQIDEQILGYLIEICGEDTIRLLNEVDKITAYADRKGESVDKTDLDMLVSKPVDSTVYDLTRAVNQGRLTQAMLILDELFYMKLEPVAILAVLSGEFCDLCRAKAAVSSKASQTEIEKDFQYKGREFRIRNAMRDCRNLNEEYLNACLELLMKTDIRLKSSRADNRIILEQLLVELSEAGKNKGV